VIREVPLGMSPDQTLRARATHALRLCVGRVPSQAEVDEVISLYQDQVRLAAANSATVEAANGTAAVPDGVTPAELAAWVNVSRTLMNLDEFVTRE